MSQIPSECRLWHWNTGVLLVMPRLYCFFLFETRLAWDLSLLDIVNEEELYMYCTFSFQKKFDSLDFLKLIFTVLLFCYFHKTLVTFLPEWSTSSCNKPNLSLIQSLSFSGDWRSYLLICWSPMYSRKSRSSDILKISSEMLFRVPRCV